MLDRVPTLPGRVKLTADTGDYYYLERADNPTIEGTPLNSTTLFDANMSERYGCNTPTEAFSLLAKVWKATLRLVDWSVTPVDGYYTQTVNIEAMKEEYVPVITLIPTNATLEDEEREGFARVGKIETGDGFIKAYTKKLPTLNLNLTIKGV